MGRAFSKKDIPTLVLAVISEGPTHGYAIARAIEQRSQALFQLKEGSLYPALKLLEEDELIEGNWEIQSSGPARKIYKITDSGRAELSKRVQEWTIYQQAVNAFIQGKSHEPAN